MKAIVLSRYGTPADLKLEERPKPEPRPGEVLVKVHTTSINDWDWSFVRGKPYVYRLLFGLRRPRVSVLGCEVAGTVESVGAGAERFLPGARVYGDLSEAGFGGFAEYVSVRESALAPMPGGMTFEQAAALPHAGMLAKQGLLDLGGIRQGEKVLINGAGGGVGVIGVQIAKQFGAEVTGIDSGAKLDMMRELGFDHVFDYTQHDFTRTGERYDLILDTKTNRSLIAYARALTPGGRYVTVGGEVSRLLQVAAFGSILRVLSGKRASIVALKTNKDMPYLATAFDTARLRVVVDGPYRLQDVPAALARFGAGEHMGKIVVRVV